MIATKLNHFGIKVIAKFTYTEAMELLDTKQKYIVVEGYKVKVSNPRFRLIRKNNSCVWCTEIATTAWLVADERAKPGDPATFTFLDKKEQLLFTKDHIMPRKRGGPNADWNYQTMCHQCNGDKGHGHPHSDRFIRRHSSYTDHEKQMELWMRKRFGH